MHEKGFDRALPQLQKEIYYLLVIIAVLLERVLLNARDDSNIQRIIASTKPPAL